jgi:choline dehydrogenase
VTRILVEDGRAVGVAYRLDGERERAGGRCAARSSSARARSGRRRCCSCRDRPAGRAGSARYRRRARRAGVGANLVDHLTNGLLVRTRGVETLASAESLRNLVRWALRGRGPLTSNLGEAVAFVRSQPELDAPDIELLLAPCSSRTRAHAADRAWADAGGRAAAAAERRHRSRAVGRSGRAPAIDPRYLSDPDGEDEATLIRGLRLARACSRKSRSRVHRR